MTQELPLGCPCGDLTRTLHKGNKSRQYYFSMIILRLWNRQVMPALPSILDIHKHETHRKAHSKPSIFVVTPILFVCPVTDMSAVRHDRDAHGARLSTNVVTASTH